MSKRIVLLLGSALCALTFTIVAMTPGGDTRAQAQSASETYLIGVQDMIGWMQDANDVVITAVEGFDSLIMIDLIETMSAEVLDLDALEDTLEAFKAGTTKARIEADDKLAALTPPERWNIGGWQIGSMERKIHSVTLDYYESLPEMLDGVQNVSDNLINIVEAVLDGETEFDYDKYSGQMAQVTREVLRSEGKVLRGMMAAIPKESPNHWYHAVIVKSNAVLIAETELLTIDYSQHNALEQRRKIGRKSIQALSDVPNLIETGREHIPIFDRQIATFIEASRSEQEILLFKNVSKVTRMFADAFDIEQRIYEIQLENARLYASDQTDEFIDPIIAENDAEFMMLMDERTRQQVIRMGQVVP